MLDSSFEQYIYSPWQLGNVPGYSRIPCNFELEAGHIKFSMGSNFVYKIFFIAE